MAGDIDDFCPGSFSGPPTDHKPATGTHPGTTCQECGNVVEISVTQLGLDPYSVDGWLIEAHDRSGQTITLEQSKPGHA